MNTYQKMVLVQKDLVKEYTPSIFEIGENTESPPSLFDTIASSINITQDRITKSRMGEDPPDILLSPKLSHIKVLEFYRAKEAINEGKKCVKNSLKKLNTILEVIGRKQTSLEGLIGKIENNMIEYKVQNV